MTLMTSLPTAIIDFAFTGVLPGNDNHIGPDGVRAISVDAARLFEDRRTDAFQAGLRAIVAGRIAEESRAVDPSISEDCLGGRLYVSHGRGETWVVRSQTALLATFTSRSLALDMACALARRVRSNGADLRVLLQCEDGLWRDRTSI